MLNLPNIEHVRRIDQRLYESLTKIVGVIKDIAQQTGTSNDPLPTPPTIATISVSASNGFFSVSIIDPAGQQQPNLGLHYFIEYSTNPAFPPSITTVFDNGPSRGAYLSLGNQTLYFRAYSQFRNSKISQKVVYGGSSPIAVSGGGSAGPTPPGGGSGSGGGGGGFGNPTRGGSGPARPSVL